MRLLIPLLYSFFIVGLAEFGDKTQFLTLTLASKYPIEKVIYGVVCAATAAMALAVIVGELVQKFIPVIFISIFAGAFFIIYGLMMIRPVKEVSEKNERDVKSHDPFLIVFVSLFIAEFGDNTQLAAMALTAKYGAPAIIWLGASLGMITVNLFGIVIGNILKNYMPQRIMNYVAGVIFILFGLITFLGVILRA